MANIAKHIRIFNPNPDDDFVAKRTSAIAQIETTIKKKTAVTDILKFAQELIFSISNPSQPNAYITSFAEAALKKQSPAFVTEEEHLQMITCTILATIQFLEKRKNGNLIYNAEDILGVALKCGLSYQTALDEEKFEALRIDLLKISIQIADDISYQSRQRKDVPKREAITLPSDGALVSYSAALDANYGRIVDDLTFNATLDREEIDILWWILGGWSNICQKKISDMNNIQAAIISSIEVVKLIRRFPSEAHAHIACRNSSSVDAFDTSEIHTALQGFMPLITDWINAHDFKSFPAVLPSFNMLLNLDINHPTSKKKRSLLEWCGRLITEGALANVLTSK